MSAARDHSRYDELAVGWALFALEPADEQVFASHLPSCARCRTTVRESQQSLATVSMAMSGPMPPARVLDRIHEAIDAPTGDQARTGRTVEQVADAPTVQIVPDPDAAPAQAASTDAVSAAQQASRREARNLTRTGSTRTGSTRVGGDRQAGSTGPRHRRPSSRPGGRSMARRTRRLSTVAAAFVLVIAIGLVSWNLNLRSDTQRQQAAINQRQATIQRLISDSTVAKLSAAQGGKNVGYVVNTGGRLEVVTAGLAVNDSNNSEYALWSISGTGGTPKLLGTFDVRNTGTDVQAVAAVPPGMSGVTTLAVSKEPGRGTPTTPTTVVASGVVNS